MILRLWSGWTTPDNANTYDDVLHTEVAPGIVDRDIPGLTAFEVWTRHPGELKQEREFLTAMWFEDWASVADFTGGDPHESVVPPAARRVLSRFDAHSRHYDLRARHLPRID